MKNVSDRPRARSVSEWVVRKITEQDDKLLRYLTQTAETGLAAGARATVDELTGMHNRSGFMHLVTRVLVWCAKGGRRASLVFFDLKPSEGDAEREQRAFAGLIATEFRANDVKARVATHGFGVLVPEASGAELARFDSRVNAWNARPSRPCALSYRARVVAFNPFVPQTLAELLRQAESLRDPSRATRASRG